MKSKFLALSICLWMTQIGAGEIPSLQEQIDELAAKNGAKASPERRAAFAEGIEAVKRADIVGKALKVGAKAPDFTLNDSRGIPLTLSEALKSGPVVLTWYRGGWCPYCNVQLAAYQGILPQIEELGARLIAVSPELPDKSLTTAEKNGLKFTVLSDPGLKVADAYGLVFKLTPEVERLYAGFFDMKEYNGPDAKTDELPLAATYVIAGDGTIVYAFLDADYKNRAEPREIIDALDALR